MMTHKTEMTGRETALSNFEILNEENGNARAILHREIPATPPQLHISTGCKAPAKTSVAAKSPYLACDAPTPG